MAHLVIGNSGAKRRPIAYIDSINLSDRPLRTTTYLLSTPMTKAVIFGALESRTTCQKVQTKMKITCPTILAFLLMIQSLMLKCHTNDFQGNGAPLGNLRKKPVSSAYQSKLQMDASTKQEANLPR